MENQPGQAGKKSKKVQELEDKVARLEQLTMAQQNTISQLEQEKKQLLQGQGVVSQAEYQGVLKQLEREKLQREQYQRLFEKEHTKRNELVAELRAQHDINAAYEKKLQEVQEKLSRKGTGKPRTNHIADEEVITLRKAGQKIMEICRITGLSPTTVTKILKHAPPH